MGATGLRQRPFDAFLVFWFCVFSISSFVYSTLVYFGWEFLDPANRAEADLLAVCLVNSPYMIGPILLNWRVRKPSPFGDSVAGQSAAGVAAT